ALPEVLQRAARADVHRSSPAEQCAGARRHVAARADLRVAAARRTTTMALIFSAGEHRTPGRAASQTGRHTEQTFREQP
ncbi:hypothetical protein, partial [Streptomyces sp. SID10692]|uniref:hypothetical protein n=1 Tax=Streptomyces sp. SID10692 TaxID=2706026 RepID=UPI00194189C3